MQRLRYHLLAAITATIPTFTVSVESLHASTHYGMAVEEAEKELTCLNCHNGTHAVNVNYCRNDCVFGSPHPIFQLYPPFDSANGFRSLAFLAQNGIRLVDGRISCISCHNLQSSDKSHLAVKNGGSRLCLTCHIK